MLNQRRIIRRFQVNTSSARFVFGPLAAGDVVRGVKLNYWMPGGGDGGPTVDVRAGGPVPPVDTAADVANWGFSYTAGGIALGTFCIANNGQQYTLDLPLGLTCDAGTRYVVVQVTDTSATDVIGTVVIDIQPAVA